MPYIRLPDGTLKKVNSGAPVDSTLKTSGAAADAKVVGDALTSLEKEINAVDEKADAAQKNIDLKLPSPTTAKVGQIIKVSAVNNEGKVISTETVDEPSAGDALELVSELGMVTPMTDKDGNILTDENGILFIF